MGKEIGQGGMGMGNRKEDSGRGWGRGGKVNGDKKGMGKENAISQYL